MKKILLSLTIITTGLLTVVSCDDCQNCRQVTYDSDGSIYSDSGTPTEYCGEELAAVEGEEPTTVGDLTNEWVCE